MPKSQGVYLTFFVFFGTAYGSFLLVGEHLSPLIARTQNAISVPARRGAVL